MVPFQFSNVFPKSIGAVNDEVFVAVGSVVAVDA